MKNVKIIIVGNQFGAFSNNQNILTYEQFQCLIEMEKNNLTSESKYQIYLGQGLSDLNIDSIYETGKSSVLAGRFSFIGFMQRNKRAVSHFTHKKCIISEPEKISDHLFMCSLMLDESDTELDVPSNSLHIQGMVLIDAAHQMARSVSEKFFIFPLDNERKNFVLNRINSSFFEYVFPLGIEFIFKMEQFRHGLDGNFQAEAIIQVKQNKKLMMSVDIDFSVMEKNTLLNIERHMAAYVVNDIIYAPNNLSVFGLIE